MTTVYPRFLGIDGDGSAVWEWANGRWTWGDTPADAVGRTRSFEPARYIEKYGRPIGLGETIDRKAEADQDPDELAKIYVPALKAEGTTRGEVALSGSLTALITMREVLDSWIEDAQHNHEAVGHKYENRGEECWRSFAPSDIRNMINDAARELGLDEFPAPAKPREDRLDTSPS